MLQVIGLLKDAFKKAGLDLYLAPYGVLPTAYECGIIEVVPEASSRSALGETSDAGLYEIFQREFGAPGTDSFEVARHNFILSSAGCDLCHCPYVTDAPAADSMAMLSMSGIIRLLHQVGIGYASLCVAAVQHACMTAAGHTQQNSHLQLVAEDVHEQTCNLDLARLLFLYT